MDDVDSPEPTRAPRGGARRVERSGLPRWFRPVILYVLFAIAAYQMSGWLFHNLKGFLGLLFLAWLFSITVEPVVDRMERFGMRRGAAAGLVLFGLVLLVVGFLSLFGALLAEQLSQLVTALPDALSSVTQWANRTFDTNFSVDSDDLRITPDTVRELAARFTPGVLGVVTSLFEVVFQLLTMLLFAFYMSAEGPALRRTVASWFPAQQQRVISTVWEISVDKAGGYVVSRLILAAFSTVATGVFLVALDVPYWLPLALWTGVVSQFVPTLGTYLAIALPAIIAATTHPINAVWVVVFGTLYQQIENYVLHPRVTARTVAIHPAVAFGAVIIGASLFGAIGALVSVPVIAVIQSLIETFGRRYELVPEIAGSPGPDAPDAKRDIGDAGDTRAPDEGSGA
ncbi:AI-2E family transporter [Rhodococcus sp. (in: high G+C Gram-positive bacteria)]|uniref:AI-2E family transporter n=1 Tax=unclassified Rhodococcus (in: high G+C Gram-positive bacteria) TaxID=192944 RepID=UPI001A045A5D|nr:AI-2E family transporter [Rhodococcus sp. (in: high G+C Gram-positive bacteria)]MBF0661799.1 AI-2E family transporter [Rhodococcus sp. (in: high G+C Gram-positive bacteria)]